MNRFFNIDRWYRFWRQVVAFAVTRTPMGSYGELVIRTATIAERNATRAMARNRTVG